ncbi:MAG: response regulator, partial [Nitrospinota bacterium]
VKPWKEEDFLAAIRSELRRSSEARETERLRRAIELSEKKYRLLFEHVPDVVYFLTAHGTFMDINNDGCRILGYGKKELLGRSADLLLPDEDECIRWCFKTRRTRDRATRNLEIKLRRKNGEVGIFRISATGLYDEQGCFLGTLGLAKDITEEVALQRKLVETERLKCLGEMSSGIAHDFNNILTAILGRVEILKRKSQGKDLHRDLDIIEKASLDGAATVRRLLEYTRLGKDGGFENIDLNEVVRDTLAITETRWRNEANLRGIKIEMVTELEEIPPISGNVFEIREALANIILNALDAMPQGGRLTIKTKTQNGSVLLAVADTGHGMSEEVKRNVFIPFFTTKKGNGTGLGMSITYGIITRHRGDISIESIEGQGTLVSITLPVASKQEIPLREEGLEPSSPARILLIEDEEHILENLSLILQMANHEVEVAGSGREGIKLFAEGEFDIVFTDLGMPGMNGWEVARAIKEMKSQIPVVLITGWGLSLDLEEAREKGVDYVVQKPFKMNQILNLLARIMKSPSVASPTAASSTT